MSKPDLKKEIRGSENIRSTLFAVSCSHPGMSMDITVEPGIRGEKMVDVSLLSFSIPNTSYNVNKGVCDKVPFSRGDKLYIATLSPGQYDSKSLPDELERIMNIQDHGGEYKVNYDTTAKRLDIRGQHVFSFNWTAVDQKESAQFFLGMGESTSSRVHRGAYTPDFWSCLNMNVSVSFVEGGSRVEGCTFPIILDAEKEITTKSYENYASAVTCRIPRAISVCLKKHNGLHVRDIRCWYANIRVRYIVEDDVDQEEETEKEKQGSSKEGEKAKD